MGILKSINQNHDNLPDNIFWTKDRWKDEIVSDEWTRLTRKLQIKFIENISETDHIQALLDEKIYQEKRLNHLIIIKKNNIDTDQWHQILVNHFENNLKSKQFGNWPVFMDQASESIINPFTKKLSFIERIKNSKYSRIQRKYKFMETQLFLLKNNIEHKELVTLLQQARIKKIGKYEKWKSRLDKKGYSTENIIEMGIANIARNHYSVNSNFNKSGKLIVTPDNLILVRRKFNFFGLSLGAFMPLVAFVRPANKIIALARIIIEYLRVPFQLIKGLRPALPTIGGLFISLSFLNLDRISLFIDKSFSSFVLRPIGFGIKVAIEQPTLIPAFLGVFTGLRFLLQRFLLRGEEIVILPHELCTQLLLDGNQIIGRWKVKGSDLVKANKGIQYRIRVRDGDKQQDRNSHNKLAQNIFNVVLGNIPETYYYQEDLLEVEVPQIESSNNPT